MIRWERVTLRGTLLIGGKRAKHALTLVPHERVDHANNEHSIRRAVIAGIPHLRKRDDVPFLVA